MKQQPTFSQPQSARVGYWLSALLTGLTAAGMLFSAAAVAAPADSDDSITIYSRLQPGAVRPELYRPVAGRHSGGQVPGQEGRFVCVEDDALDVGDGWVVGKVDDGKLDVLHGNTVAGMHIQKAGCRFRSPVKSAASETSIETL